MLVHPKDKAKKSEICGPIYHIQCGGKNKNNCSHDYIGETERTLNHVSWNIEDRALLHLKCQNISTLTIQATKLYWTK